jgi:hypothetical protein
MNTKIMNATIFAILLGSSMAYAASGIYSSPSKPTW